MSNFEFVQFDTPDRLRREAEQWDALWQRSDVTIPTARAELVAQWVEWFAAEAKFRALLVRQEDRLVAALPLVGRRVGRLATVGGLTMNYWSPNGELLLDPEADAPAVLDRLLAGVRRLGWPLFRLEMTPHLTTHWQAMQETLSRHGWSMEVHPRWEVGLTETQGDFDVFLETRSRNLRRSLRKDFSQLAAQDAAPIAFHLERDFDDVEASLREVFEMEHRGWKGEAGGSVLAVPGILDFYSRQARRLAEWGDLRLATLRQNNKLLAFDLGWMGAGVYHSFKVGYDPAYRKFGPGHLLREQLLRALFDDSEVRAIDYQGPRTEAIDAWTTSSYPIARLTFAPPTLPGRLAWTACRAATKLVRWRRGQ
ncbi:MAG: GNAT family N-acetyltransferase [Pirellulales bacterium]|nr:GNAT family N-acetyltransferase [Pirellulales bacterium]